jgi:hypothetical protein
MTTAMKTTGIAAIFMVSAGAFAQTAIAPPQAGFVEDSAHTLRPVYGFAGNFILGRSLTGPIVSEAFSGSLGLLKTDASLAAFDSQGALLASMDLAAGPALFAFSPNGTTALVFIAESNTWIEWRGNRFARVPLDREQLGAGAVVAIAFPNPFEATLMVQRNSDSLWEIHLPLGAAGTLSQNVLAGVRAPVLALPAGDLVYPDAQGIVVRRPAGPEVHIAASLPETFSLHQMNQDWIQLTDLKSSARFAIHTTPGREGLYRLPE